MIAPLATNAHAVFVPPPSIPRFFSSPILYVAAVHDPRPKCKRKFIGGHRPPLQSSRAKSSRSHKVHWHLSRPYVRSLSPSRTGVVFAVRDDARVRTGPLFRESSFV